MRLDRRRSSSAKILEAVLQDLLDCVQAFCTYVAQARKDVSNDIDRMEEEHGQATGQAGRRSCSARISQGSLARSPARPGLRSGLLYLEQRQERM